MRIAVVEGSLFVGALVFIACSGGPDSGPIAGPGPGPSEPGEGVERGDNPFDFQSSNGPDSSSSTNVTSTGSGPCVSCNDLLNGAIGQQACPGSEGAIANIVNCACAGDCSADCGTGFCAGDGFDAGCATCLATDCRTELEDCQEN